MYIEQQQKHLHTPVLHPATGQQISYAYLVASLIYVIVVTSSMWFYPATAEDEAMVVPGGRFLYNSVLLVMASCIVLFYRHAFGLLMRYKLLSALLVAYFASVIVSIEMMESLNFSIRLLLLVTFFGIVALIVEPQTFMRIITGFFLVAALANLLYVVAVPQYAIMSGIHEGAWRGLFSHKNQFGYFCVYGLVLCFNLLPRGWLLYGGIGFVYLLMLGKSQSGGALACGAVGLMLSCALMYTPYVHRQIKILLLSIAVLLTVAFLPFYEPVTEWLLALLGKDPTLTNRTDVWGLYLAEFWQSPVLGLGANAYLFNEAFMTRIEAGMRADEKISPHNGYLAMLIQVGIVGLLLYCLLCARILVQGVIGALRCAPQWHKLLVIFTALHLIRGIGETGGSVKLTLSFALIVVAYVYTTQWKRRHEPEKTRKN